MKVLGSSYLNYQITHTYVFWYLEKCFHTTKVHIRIWYFIEILINWVYRSSQIILIAVLCVSSVIAHEN